MNVRISSRQNFRGIDNRNRLTYPRVMPGLVGSDLRADRERASRTSRTGSPRRCNHRRNGIGTKGRLAEAALLGTEEVRSGFDMQMRIILNKLHETDAPILAVSRPLVSCRFDGSLLQGCLPR